MRKLAQKYAGGLWLWGKMVKKMKIHHVFFPKVCGPWKVNNKRLSLTKPMLHLFSFQASSVLDVLAS